MSVLTGDERVLVGVTPRQRSFETHQLRRPDYWIVAAVISLGLMGLVMVYSASYVDALNEDVGPAYWALKHLQSLLTGFVALVVFAAIPYRFWRRISVPAMGVTLFLLVLVLVGPSSISQ